MKSCIYDAEKGDLYSKDNISSNIIERCYMASYYASDISPMYVYYSKIIPWKNPDATTLSI